MAFFTTLTHIINTLCRPAILFSAACVMFFLVFFKLRELFSKKQTIWAIEIGLALFIGVSMFHPTFRDVVTKPDNVPIVGMLFLMAFFTWLTIHKAVINDKLIDAGQD